MVSKKSVKNRFTENTPHFQLEKKSHLHHLTTEETSHFHHLTTGNTAFILHIDYIFNRMGYSTDLQIYMNSTLVFHQELNFILNSGFLQIKYVESGIICIKHILVLLLHKGVRRHLYSFVYLMTSLK